MAPPNKNVQNSSVERVRIWYGLLILVVVVFGLRLFYIQIIRHSHYKNAALSDQLKQYEIPASRGTIRAQTGGGLLPVVLNQKLYIVYADPAYIKKPDELATKVQGILGGNAATYAEAMKTKGSRYAVLAKKVPEDKEKRILGLKSPGLGVTAQEYRMYPQGSLAAQVLGFVDDTGKGRYGIEQALDAQLRGKPGQLKAITDINGVPLAASKDNIQTSPVNGRDIILTINMAMQQQLEAILGKAVKDTKASGGSALIMNPNTGAIKAMANSPTFNPAEYFKVTDGKLFSNAAAANPIEVGSVMKPLTTAAALDQHAIRPDSSYYDPSFWKVDGFRITNIEEDGGAGTRSIKDILNMSLNTGATWELMQMGGGKINDKARNAWHDYMVNHYLFGRSTGIEQGFEASGFVPNPADNGAGIDLTYANTTFGQAMTATAVQMGAAYSAVLNGGTYYAPRLIDGYGDGISSTTKVSPKVVKSNIVRPETTKALIPMMEYTVDNHNFSPRFDQSVYSVGGKTGTAQIAKPGGGYYDDLFNGTYVGFVGGDKPQYVIIVFMDRPTNGGYAGTAAAQPVFGKLAHMLIDNSYVTPRSK